LHRSHLDLGRYPLEQIRDPRCHLGPHQLTLLGEHLSRHEYGHTSGPGVIGRHAVVVSKYLRPSPHEPSCVGQPRELRGERRRHAILVKLLAQAKTTGSLIQRPSLRGTVTTGEPARTNVAKSTDLQRQTAWPRPRVGIRNERWTIWAQIGTNEFGAQTNGALTRPTAPSPDPAFPWSHAQEDTTKRVPYLGHQQLRQWRLPARLRRKQR